MASELTWRQAIEKILGATATPLHYNEITERIIGDGLRKSLGATPSATVNAQLSASIKHDGAKSPYIRIAKYISPRMGEHSHAASAVCDSHLARILVTDVLVH